MPMAHPFSTDGILPVMVSVLGTVALAVPYLTPGEQDAATALVFAPTVTRAAILHDIAALNLPIRDIRWNGHLVELDLTGLPRDRRIGMTRQLASPALQIAVRPTALCTDPSLQKETP